MPGVVNPVTLPVRDGKKKIEDADHKALEPSGQLPVASDKFPVPQIPTDTIKKVPSLHDPSDPNNQGVTHLRTDIRDIGENLNNVNNELYHVLNELLNGQTKGFEHTLYNMRARDYNAALPDRQRSIKPLRNPITGVEHGNFFTKDDNGKDVIITIEALEALTNPEKEEILVDLGMDRSFNLLHHMIFASKDPKKPDESTVDGTVDADLAENAKAAMKDVTGDQGIAEYLFDETKNKPGLVEMYKTYLTTQLRISVGLPRNYCP